LEGKKTGTAKQRRKDNNNCKGRKGKGVGLTGRKSKGKNVVQKTVPNLEKKRVKVP